MTAEHDEQLEQALTELTTWHGPAPQLWRRALGSAKPKRPRTTSRFQWLLRQRLSAGVAASIIVVALGTTIAINLPHLGVKYDRSQAPRRRAPATSNLRGVEVADELTAKPPAVADIAEFREGMYSLGYLGADEMGESGAYALPGSGGRFTGRGGRGMGAGFGRGAPASPAGQLPVEAIDDAAAMEPRQIVRKATVELVTDDVRAAFLKAGMIISEAGGEYAQESSLTGSGETAQANLTLRVAAGRLSQVMNELRGLGEVRSEQVTGQDVTTQAIDLEARLRNEQRVEAELLELLEKRQDAPLREILELRSTLSNVRGSIERLTAQRQRLSRLVSLATVLVIIRTDQSQERPADFSIAQYFGDGLARAWQKGLVFLADTFGLLLSILVGGLIWWILLALVFAAIWRYRRRSIAASNSHKP